MRRHFVRRRQRNAPQASCYRHTAQGGTDFGARASKASHLLGQTLGRKMNLSINDSKDKLNFWIIDIHIADTCRQMSLPSTLVRKWFRLLGNRNFNTGAVFDTDLEFRSHMWLQCISQLTVPSVKYLLLDQPSVWFSHHSRGLVVTEGPWLVKVQNIGGGGEDVQCMRDRHFASFHGFWLNGPSQIWTSVSITCCIHKKIWSREQVGQ